MAPEIQRNIRKKLKTGGWRDKEIIDYFYTMNQERRELEKKQYYNEWFKNI